MPACTNKQLLILCCSPHANGSAARAARIIARGASESGTAPCLVSLWDKRIAGCIHCDACAKAPHACPLAANDDCEAVFSLVRSHEHVLWISPVYFYGLPSQAKALIDRGQRFYNASLAAEAPAGASADSSADALQGHVPETGSSTALFLAGQTKGAKLFEGSRLSVRYFMGALGCPVEKNYALRGINTPDDLAPGIEESLLDLGRSLAGRALGTSCLMPGRTPGRMPDRMSGGISAPLEEL